MALPAFSQGQSGGNAVQLQGRTVNATSPINAQCLVWNAANLWWVPGSCGAGAGMAIGNAVVGGTPGSVLFVNAGPVLAQDNTNLNFNDATNTLTVDNLTLTGTPAAPPPPRCPGPRSPRPPATSLWISPRTMPRSAMRGRGSMVDHFSRIPILI